MNKFNDTSRIAVLEERVGNIQDDIRETRIDMGVVRNDLAKIKLLIAETKGWGSAIKYITHAGSGIFGAIVAMLGGKHL